MTPKLGAWEFKNSTTPRADRALELLIPARQPRRQKGVDLVLLDAENLADLRPVPRSVGDPLGDLSRPKPGFHVVDAEDAVSMILKGLSEPSTNTTSRNTPKRR